MYTGTLRTDGPQRSNFRRLKIKLKHFSQLFAIGAVFKTPQSNREMRTAMPRAGRRPTTSKVQKVQKIQKFQDSWRVLLVEGLLEVRKVTFSSDSSRKWPSLLLVGENLDRSWRGALLC